MVNVIGIATRYELDGPGIIPLGARFSGRGDHPASFTKGTASFPWIKRPGRGVIYTLPSTTKFKERMDLQLFSPSGPSWPVLR
jgi:hypothetical protein